MTTFYFFITTLIKSKYQTNIYSFTISIGNSRFIGGFNAGREVQRKEWNRTLSGCLKAKRRLVVIFAAYLCGGLNHVLNDPELVSESIYQCVKRP